MSKRSRVQHWVQTCGANEVFVYYRTNGVGLMAERDEELFAYMRKLSDAGLVFLFQRPLPAPPFTPWLREWEYCARRCRPKDHVALDKVSAAVQGPAIQATED